MKDLLSLPTTLAVELHAALLCRQALSALRQQQAAQPRDAGEKPRDVSFEDQWAAAWTGKEVS